MAEEDTVWSKAPVLAAFGNPILDMCVLLADDQVLKKHHLLPDGQKEITESEKEAILRDVRGRYTIQYCAGGVAQNTLRVFQWLSGVALSSVFLGGIGTDEHGKMLENLVKKCGVITRYTYHEDYPTATCIALIQGANRSLVAHLGAANVYEPHHLDAIGIRDVLSAVKMIYIEGFFITHSFSTALKLIHYCQSEGIALAFNLCGAYVCEKYPSQVLELLKHADIVFGNSSEFKKLNESLNWKCRTIHDIAVQAKDVGGSIDNIRRRKLDLELLRNGKVVVVTQGKESVVLVHGKSMSACEVEVPSVEPSLIKDTTGAGDSFVAGFLAGMFSGEEISTCVKWGCWTAQQIIQQIGCAIPNYSPVGLRNVHN
ncbi:uncharacterized protein [Anabrus simplex]|uniref:uncharacterized protein n=1 Tax=Anabrus simplex TaxID=316456 RepID=UPI0034DCE4EE